MAVERRAFERPITAADAGMIEVSIGQRPGLWDWPSWSAHVRRCVTGVARVYRRDGVAMCQVVDVGDPVTGRVVA